MSGLDVEGAVSLLTATAVGLRLLERVEAVVERQRPDLPPDQRKAMAAELAYSWVNTIGDTLDHVLAAEARAIGARIASA